MLTLYLITIFIIIKTQFKLIAIKKVNFNKKDQCSLLKKNKIINNLYCHNLWVQIFDKKGKICCSEKCVYIFLEYVNIYP